jgi:hypothetical protein
MNKLFEVYTENKTTKELEELKHYYVTNKSGCNFEQGARLCIEKENENILIELDLPTLDLKEQLDGKGGKVYMTAYAYTGKLEDYDCENEIDSKFFVGDLANAEQIMLEYALSL